MMNLIIKFISTHRTFRKYNLNQLKIEIKSNPKWWKRITWMKDGVEVPNPFGN